MRGLLGQIFRYAVATGRAEWDPTADLRGALPQPNENHHAAITDPKEVAPLLRAMDGYQGHFVVKCALRLAPLLFVRPGELRHAEWAEIDLDESVWNIPARFRIVTLLTKDEKDALEILAWRSGRSMSGYIRYLVIEDIERNSD